MPSLEMHCQDCVEKLGEPFTYVHQWLDQLWPVLGPKHRAVRHNDTGVDYIRLKWGDRAAQAAVLHIKLDEDFVYQNGIWVRAKMDAF
jgi:hypothetical protein